MSDTASAQNIQAGSITLDPVLGDGLLAGQRLKLPPLHFRLLYRLAEAAPAPVSRHDLVTYVWDGAAVADETLKQRVSLLRDVLRGIEGAPEIETVRGQGYRLLSAESTGPVPPAPVSQSPLKRWLVAGAVAVLALIFAVMVLMPQTPRGPVSVALLAPVTGNLSEKDQWWIRSFQLALADQMTAVQGISPLSGDASAQDAGPVVKLASGFQRTDGQLIADFQLIEGDSNRIIWTERFSYDERALAEGGANLPGYIVTILHQRLAGGELPAPGGPSAAAYDAYLAGMALIYSPDADKNMQAREYLKRALELEPDFHLASAMLAAAEADAAIWFDAGTATTAGALRRAETTLKARPDLAEAHYAFGLACLAAGRVQDGLAALDTAEIMLPYMGRKIRGYRAHFSAQEAANQPS